MIATLTGTIAEKLDELVIVDTKGVGYGVLTPLEDYGRISVGENHKFYIYEHIREAVHDLYGFIHQGTKELFERLLEVNGVGPKMALNILSIGSEKDVRGAIAGGNTKFIQNAPGVGKRVAERVVVDLKDKVGLLASADGIFVSSHAAQRDEAVQALVVLGFNSQDAVAALGNIDSKLSTEERVKRALKEAAL